MINITYKVEDWPLKEPFRFAGYSVEALEAIHVTATREGHEGHGEGLFAVVFPVTMAQIVKQIEGCISQVAIGADAEQCCAALPAGAARNALDCALWDLRAKESNQSIWALAGLPEGPPAIKVDQTVGLDTPEAMAIAARNSSHQVIKIKLDDTDIIERVSAIRAARPDADLIVDANLSWSVEILNSVAHPLADLGVRMIEQPVPPAQDGQLSGVTCPLPLFADESCHVAADVTRLKEFYQGVNIKLDKTGGLTEALALAKAARSAGMGVMVGCMSGTSLSMAPAYIIASLSDWADLDGPLMLQSDRKPTMQYRDGDLLHYDTALWG